MKIGYGKVARSWSIDQDNPSTLGGDIDVIRLLKRLSSTRPDDEFILIGRCKGGSAQSYGYEDNVINPWHDWGWQLPAMSPEEMSVLTQEDLRKPDNPYFRSRDAYRELTKDLKLDALVLWIGQVANSSHPLPMAGEDWDSPNGLTKPYLMNNNYSHYLLDLINRTGIEPIFLVADPRNYWKPREVSKPFLEPVLAQYNFKKSVNYEQYQQWDKPWQSKYRHEGSQIVANLSYKYAGVELTALDEPSCISFSEDPNGRELIGIITNENDPNQSVEKSRMHQLQKYIFDKWPDAPIYGKWTEKSLKKMGREINPVPYTEMYNTLRRFKCTMTFPASGSGWATAKPWEAFAVGTIMFFHKHYDDQNHVIPKDPKWRELKKFLRVYNQRQLWERIEQIDKDDNLFKHIAQMQRKLFEEAFEKWQGGALKVHERLDKLQESIA